MTAIATTKVSRLRAYLQLMRPANIVTAWADILAGYAATGLISLDSTTSLSSYSPPHSSLAWLLLSTSGLYAAGVVFNDIFDADLDAIERPERPIPSHQVSMVGAISLGIVLLTIGIVAAAQVSSLSLGIAAIIATLALLYDKLGKHQTTLGPINMGLCRAANLLLGVSAAETLTHLPWLLPLIPLSYIGAVTAISQGEVNGGKPRTSWLALGLLTAAIVLLIGLSAWPNVKPVSLLPFTALLIGLVYQPFISATVPTTTTATTILLPTIRTQPLSELAANKSDVNKSDANKSDPSEPTPKELVKSVSNGLEPYASKFYKVEHDEPNVIPISNIRAAVKAGILSLIVLDAAISAGFASWPYGLLVLALLPLSRALARLFAMT
jgi:4-hydroxybenzoate polyprenyltransferase